MYEKLENSHVTLRAVSDVVLLGICRIYFKETKIRANHTSMLILTIQSSGRMYEQATFAGPRAMGTVMSVKVLAHNSLTGVIHKLL